jgi:8-amino-7-oxononanoate synthase
MLACAVAASLTAIRNGQVRRERLARNVERLRAALAGVPWRLLPSQTPIQALIVGDNDAAVALSQRLWAQGIFVPAIRPPTVPAGTARLRISVTAGHDDADIDALVAALQATR